MNRRISCLVVLVMCICNVSRATTYNLTDLGTFGGTDSDAYGINNYGQVVGDATITKKDEFGNPIYHAFLYSGSTMYDLGTLGGQESNANDINDSGQVVGQSNRVYPNGYVYTHACIYNGSSITDLDTSGDSLGSNGCGINASGQAVGDVYKIEYGNGGHHAFLYSGGMVDIGTLGGQNSSAHDINDSGQIVGYAKTTGNTATHAFLYSGGTMHDLGTIGGWYSNAYGINASGQVVGESNITGNTAHHAFLCSGSTMTDLGTLGGTYSEASGINASGQVVGSAYTTGNAAWHAFLYSGGTMKDLNTLINLPSGWTLAYANSINDAGQIVGSGYDGSWNEHAFLLTPMPAEISWLTGNGSWGSASNWSLNTVPQGKMAIFANSTSATITLDGNRTVSDLRFNGGSYIISPGSVPSSKLMLQCDIGAVTIDVLAGSHTIDVPLEMDSDLIINTMKAASLTTDRISDLDGSKDLTVSGNGNLIARSIQVGVLTLRAGACVTISPIPGGPLSSGITAVPEPSALVLLAIGAVSLSACWRRRAKQGNELSTNNWKGFEPVYSVADRSERRTGSGAQLNV
jgi:probable HAF family extracellular repeat protein